jgi:asparagine synthase (glutamine-hydrolysing)
MCGIVGMLVRDGLRDADVAEVGALTDLMSRRGPDDSGAWDDGVACALGFRRLAIIDLSEGGHQPMVSADGEHVVVFNGEIYNYRELRAELESRGRRFRSASDTEVVLQSLAEWGIAALARFNGMFAIGWYRPGSRTLVLARDPIGIKPLNWWWSPEAFVFGSQYDQVVRHRRCHRDRVDPAALHLYLRLGYLPQHYGLIEDTGQVSPGHYLEVSPGEQPVSRRFRTPNLAPPPGDRLRGEQADEAVAAMVTDAVRRQQVSDVRMGAFLSGGVDSPLVAANMAPPDGDVVPAFTIGTDDAASDESAPATEYAELLGLEHHLRRIGGADAIALLDDVASANSEPFGDYSSFPTLLVSALAAEHVKTVQSGDGGDELFWGYPRFMKVAGARRWFGLPHAVRVAAYGATKPLPVDRRPPRGVMFPTIGDWYLDAHSGLRQADFDRIAPDLAPLPADLTLFDRPTAGTGDDLLQWMRTNELTCHLPMVLQKVDRAAMYHSLEVRVPLLDLELVDLAARVDPSAAISGGVGKQVLRHALERRVPPERIPVPKRGFTVPMRSWLAEDLQPAVQALLLDRDPFPSGFFDRRGLAAFYGDHRSGRLNLTRGLWNLLALQLWADRHLQPLPAAGAPGA